MATQLELVNKVLVRLRENEVSSTSATTYSKLIREFVKQATHEVEMAWDWVQLRATVQIPVIAGTIDYILTDVGTDANILQVYEDTTDYTIYRAPSYAWMNTRLLANTRSTGAPTHFDINGNSSGDPVMNFWPEPDSAYSVNVNLVRRSHLSVDSDTTPMADLLVVLRATFLSIEERGDDDGTTLGVLDEQYRNMLQDAIQLDAANYADETVWAEE